MKNIVIKVLLETNETVYRDLLVSETSTLLDLHLLIKKAFNFNGTQLASFVQENEGWGNDIEFPLENLMDVPQKEMADVTCGSLLKEPEDQLLYTYDYLNEWKFYLEVIEIQETKETLAASTILKRFGDAPKENERELDGNDAEKILMNAMLGEEFEDEEDLFNDDPFSSSNMESLDDYEEYL